MAGSLLVNDLLDRLHGTETRMSRAADVAERREGAAYMSTVDADHEDPPFPDAGPILDAIGDGLAEPKERL